VPDRARADPGWLRALCSTEPCAGTLAHSLTAAVAALALIAGLMAWQGGDAQLRYPDAFDYAQMGRQLAEGHGMTSLQVFPFVLGWLEAEGLDTAPPWPNIWRFPLPVIARAASFRLFGPTDAAALLPALLFSILTAPLLFRLANRLGGPSAGLLAAAVWIASPGQQQLALSGLTEPGAALLAVTIAGLALRARARCDLPSCAALGAAFGLAYLQRSNLFALAPAALVLVATGNPTRRPLRLGVLAACALGLAAPWLLRNAVEFGEPLLNLTSQRGLLRLGLGRDPFYAYAVPDAGAVLGETLRRYPGGWSWDWLGTSVPTLFGRDLAWLLPVGVLATLADARNRRGGLWALAWSGLLLTALVFAPLYPDVLRFYWPYAPLFLAGSSAALVRATARLPWPAAAPAVAACLAAAFALLTPRGAAAPLFPEPAALELSWLSDRLPPEATLASDTSFAVAWQARRPSVRFVGNYPVMSTIDSKAVRIGGIYWAGASLAATRALREPPLARLFEPAASETGVLFMRRTPPLP